MTKRWCRVSGVYNIMTIMLRTLQLKKYKQLVALAHILLQNKILYIILYHNIPKKIYKRIFLTPKTIIFNFFQPKKATTLVAQVKYSKIKLSRNQKIFKTRRKNVLFIFLTPYWVLTLSSGFVGIILVHGVSCVFFTFSA